MRHAFDEVATVSETTERTEGQRGQTVALFAIFLVVIVASVGLVLDTGGAYAQQRNQQRAADLAAVAGAVAETNCWSGCAGGGTPRAAMITAATNSAQANGYVASELTINIPPTSGPYAGVGGDCSTIASMPCWIQVGVNRPHPNGFASIVPGQSSWAVSAHGVAVGGVANAVANGIAPIMFDEKSVGKDANAGTDQKYCDPDPSKCTPNNNIPDGTNLLQFNYTNFCAAQSGCNFNSGNAPGGGQYIVNNGLVQTVIDLGMSLGPNNKGQHTNICHDLLATYPNGADLPVAIEKPDPNDPTNNALLVGFWVWHLDTANSSCQGSGGEQLSGYFTKDLTKTLPLTITPGGGKATTGQFIARLVQ